MQTPDMTDTNIEKIGTLFPNCIAERKSLHDGYLLARFDRDLTEEVKRKPYYIVMRDAGFVNDNTANNSDQISAYYSKETIRRII